MASLLWPHGSWMVVLVVGCFTWNIELNRVLFTACRWGWMLVLIERDTTLGGWIVAHCVFCLIVIPAKRGVTEREMGA